MYSFNNARVSRRAWHFFFSRSSLVAESEDGLATIGVCANGCGVTHVNFLKNVRGVLALAYYAKYAARSAVIDLAA